MGEEQTTNISKTIINNLNKNSGNRFKIQKKFYLAKFR